MTKHIITTICIGFALTLGACEKGDTKKDAQAKKTDTKKTDGADAGADGGEEPIPDAPELDPKVEKAVDIANQISSDPGSADSILAGAGLDREAFEALLYEIAKDPELSKSYAIAREA